MKREYHYESILGIELSDKNRGNYELKYLYEYKYEYDNQGRLKACIWNNDPNNCCNFSNERDDQGRLIACTHMNINMNITIRAD